MQQIIDIRSDVVTRAPKQMLQAMRNAQIRNDIELRSQDDVHATRFEKQIANLFHKQSSIFFPTASMANIASVMLHTRPGSQIIIASSSHSIQRQSSSFAFLCGVQTRQVETKSGLITAKQVRDRIRKSTSHVTFPDTDLIFLQNATFRGRAWDLKDLKEIRQISKQLNVKVHIDGARIFNALISKGLLAKDIAEFYDTMTLCLTKGLCCPIGAMIVGSTQHIARLKVIRKSLGGGLWHPGLLTSAGQYAINNLIGEIKKDNQITKLLASQMSKIKGVKVDVENTDVNMIYWSIDRHNFNHQSFWSFMNEKGIKIKKYDQDTQDYRFVTHMHIREKEVERIISVMNQYFNK